MYLGDPPQETAVSGATVKIRDPWRVGIFTVLTLGIYTLVWFYRVNCELEDYAHKTGARNVGQNPVFAVVVLALGIVLVIPAIVIWIWFLVRINRAHRHAGITGTMTLWYAIATYLVGLIPIGGAVVYYEWVQFNLNLLWAGRSLRARAPASSPVLSPAPA